jgi:thioredoxin-like negative regulator of GroEL
LQPEWEIVARSLKGEIKVAKVDATVNKKLFKRMKISFYPTIYLFTLDSFTDDEGILFEGGR